MASRTTRRATSICDATQRPLYSYKPDDGTNMVPDLAQALPEVSEDGKTVTVKIRTGVKFSKPVDRVVTSKDVKYAMERGFFSTVANGYSFYFEDIVGAKPGAKPGTKIEGIETPDDQTIVVHPLQGDRRRDGLRRAGAADDRARAGGVRGEVRQGGPDDLRREPGRDRALHDRE